MGKSPLIMLLKTSMIAAFIVAVMGVRWGGDGKLHAQITGTSTGWCTDYSGRNFRCGEGGTSSSGGGGYGGCASSGRDWDAFYSESARQDAQRANRHWDDGDYASAAFYYSSALSLNENLSNVRARRGASLNNLGVAASQRADDMSADLYMERAYADAPNNQTIRGNRQRIASMRKTCSACGRAIINDTAYGVDNSARIVTYFHQASVNYRNCTRRLDCAGSTGAEFKKLLNESCMYVFTDEAGLRGCVRQLVSQYR